MSDRLARVALSRLSEPGDLRLRRVVRELGAVRVHDLLREEHDVRGVYADVAERLRGLDPERELEQAAGRGIRFVCPGDAEWPDQLAALDAAGDVNGRGGEPLGLWVRGPLDLAAVTDQALAVVGSRSATTYGADVAGQIACEAAGAGFAVVSGAAFGIDVAAHRGALAGRGPTVAVLACGVDRAYPAAHRTVLDYIAGTGLLVSELPPGCAPTRLRFLSRNRVIAALSRGTVVVEAAVRSGALNTAHWANRMGRIVMGVPGPVTSAPSAGVHDLIRRGEAQLVTGGADVLELVAAVGDHLAPVPRGEERVDDRLSLAVRQVLDAVPVARPAGETSIARTAGLSVHAVEQALRRLRGAGLVERVDHGWRRTPDTVSSPEAPAS
ncbi:DNA-processing protein DprA [Nocardioides mesophilus]|uniref:DNA-protecting protein DprA n=1 Tax=Nocardioides mesophilus TaxID=433659 RepID=A0A7G9R964_9ACTN|nr:DNA-processing protein DprA [Nocardioides mesophilus]QNN52139.1 DNA-protecting protein DprA [Nocardioides mesophilus]